MEKKMKDKLYDKKEKKTILIIFQNQEKKITKQNDFLKFFLWKIEKILSLFNIYIIKINK